ncbi:MAG: hypothetical protein ACLQIB_09420 [Isosphaeraceae bacterium]
MSTISNDILAARRFGVVHCGVSSLASPTALELAREFGLRADESCYRDIDQETARSSVLRLLHRDLAYDAEVMPIEQARHLTDRFFAQFGDGSRFFTNNSCSVTDATFDEGVLVLAPNSCGCLWVEDED